MAALSEQRAAWTQREAQLRQDLERARAQEAAAAEALAAKVAELSALEESSAEAARRASRKIARPRLRLGQLLHAPSE